MASSIFGAEQRIGEPLSALAVLTGRHGKNTRDPVLVKSQRVNEINESTIYCVIAIRVRLVLLRPRLFMHPEGSLSLAYSAHIILRRTGAARPHHLTTRAFEKLITSIALDSYGPDSLSRDNRQRLHG